MSFDLHTHTTCSDGSYTPEDLIMLAKEKGLKGLSITDHDTVDAYPKAFEHAEKHKILLISGIEFSCHFNNHNIHVLGYSFKFSHPSIANLCVAHKERRILRNLEILEKLKSEKMEISEEELNQSASGVVGRPHIAKLLKEKGYVQEISDAFKLYIGEGKKCYSPGKHFSIEQAVQAIQEAQGFAVLAHPHLYYNYDLVKNILNTFSFDGIECEYALMPKAKNEPWSHYAKQKSLIITGGSDFHGTIKPMNPLGSSIVIAEQIPQLLERFYLNYPDYCP